MSKVREGSKIKRSPGDQAVQVLIYIFVGVCAVVTVLPFLYVLAGSFATERELTERAFFIIPTEFSLNAYKYIIRTGDVFKGLKNSVIVTVIGTAINMLFTTTLAYPLSRSYLRGRNFFINMVIITMLFSGGMVPSYLVVSSLKLTNTYWSLWLPGAISAFNMIIIKNYFQGIPKELEEAATIDGCNRVQAMTRVLLPVAAPGIVTTLIFIFINAWNEYTVALCLISTDTLKPLTVGINTFNGYNMIEWQYLFAASIFAIIPVVILFMCIEKNLVSGLASGGVKG